MTEHPYLARMKDAAYEREQEHQAERNRVRDLVIRGNSRDRLGDIVRLGDDYLVEVHGTQIGEPNSPSITWTTVVDGKASSFHHYSQERAVLHLLARRHGDRAGDSVTYAARVLNIPDNDA